MSVRSTHIIHHEGCDGSADLVVGFGFSCGTEENKEEPGKGKTPCRHPWITGIRVLSALGASDPKELHSPGGDGHLCHPSQHRRLEEPHKSHEGLLQEFHFSHQHVGGLCILGDLLDELVLQLLERRGWGRERLLKFGFSAPFTHPERKGWSCSLETLDLS